MWNTIIDLALLIEDIDVFSSKSLNTSDKASLLRNQIQNVTKNMKSIRPHIQPDEQLSQEFLESIAAFFSADFPASAEGAKIAFETAKKQWVQYFRKETALCIIGIYNDRNYPPLTVQESRLLCPFIERAEIDSAYKAMALYMIARSQIVTEPLLAYIYTMKAFLLNPELGKASPNYYIFNPEALTETYQERCPFCNCEDSSPYYCVEQYPALGNGAGQPFSPMKLWMKCNGCGTLYAYNFPVDQVGEINGQYTKSQSGESISPRYKLNFCGDIINRCKEYTKGHRYLEVGVGRGEMLATALEMGYNVHGVEICREDCERLSAHLGIDMTWCDFLEYETSSRYDIIIMGNVLEHMRRPMDALKKAWNLLSQGGVLWLSTPNYNSGHNRLKKWSSSMWNQKNHFTYFSYESLSPSLKELGFEIARYDVSVDYVGTMDLYCVKA